MIQAEKLVKCFGDFTALSELTAQIPQGSIYGLVGSNGSGKSTFLRLCAGVYMPDGGSLQVFGEPVYENVPLKSRIFFVADDLYFLPQSNLEEIAAFYRGIYPSFSQEKYQKLCTVFPLDPRKKLNTFSKGMKRQAALLLGLACAFVAAVLVVALEDDTGWAAAIGVVGCLLIGLAAPLQAVPVLEALSSSMLPVLAGTVLEAVALVLVVAFLVAGSARARALQIGISFAGAAGAVLVGAGAVGPGAAAAAGLTPRTTLIAVLVALVIGSLVGGVLETVRARRRSRRPVDG